MDLVTYRELERDLGPLVEARATERGLILRRLEGSLWDLVIGGSEVWVNADECRMRLRHRWWDVSGDAAVIVAKVYSVIDGIHDQNGAGRVWHHQGLVHLVHLDRRLDRDVVRLRSLHVHEAMSTR